jgi:Trypsin
MRKFTLALTMLVLLLSRPTPSFAAWGGKLDGDDHPMVGAIYADFDGNGVITWDELICSGSYAGPSVDGQYDVYLTAAHCVAPAGAFGFDTLYVSFDTDAQDNGGIPENLIASNNWTWDPRFGHDSGNLYDSGLILLPAGSVQGIDPVQLPPAGLLDQMKREGTLKHSVIDLVGYGVIPIWNQRGGTHYEFDAKRREAQSQVTGLTRSWLRLLQQRHATHRGGLCFGDSGSPQFLEGTTMVVSTTTGGNKNCNSINYDYRLDTTGAREFLGQYLPLP